MIASSAANGSSISSTGRSCAERAGQRDALAHAAGELVRALGPGIGQVDQVQQPVGPLAALGARDPAQFQGEFDVGARGEPGQQRGVLEHEGGAGRRDADGPGRGRFEPGDEVQQRGLAAPGGPEHATNSPSAIAVLMPESTGAAP